ncbi:hypothetical protein GGS23DRAFT_610042 [Durotheca rogersii]|uniref:uncharacterized protein n=1 Tax=Durotheca rogersii TaxID=419775 RepID=UPI00221EB9F3|nr:uncharacterized protein GGS23DRAFT_610042 [Durotheca rogersii]KAI5862894.1 hypothetical protein GGS23DRAFT_610042 [Durotheca rogersii]
MKTATAGDDSEEALAREVAELERRLRRAREKLARSRAGAGAPPAAPPPSLATQAPHHYLLLLSDSALPLGSFAFSAGLESYAAHARGRSRARGVGAPAGPALFAFFLPVSAASCAGAALPFVLAAHRDPSSGSVAALDDALDAAVPCAVARRASVAQGRALLAVWERSLAAPAGAEDALRPYAELLRAPLPPSPAGADDDGDDDGEPPPPPPVAAHFAPLFGAVAARCGLSARQAAYVFLLGHAKALASAAVRAGLLGPYHAHRALAAEPTRACLAAAVDAAWDVPIERAGQSAPAVDLWVGRHELLYSRIFNS